MMNFTASLFIPSTPVGRWPLQLKHTENVCQQNRIVRCSAQPPRPKSSYYKNPSKAIEKGGGFYIPGLRGERLRYFVAAVSGTLLTLNHFASSVRAPSLTVSECIATTAVLAVFVTAVNDSAQQSKVSQFEATQTGEVASTEKVSSTSGTRKDTIPQDVTALRDESDVAAWMSAVCCDLTKATHVAHIQDGRVGFSSGNIDQNAECGAAVDRVDREGRDLYIADSSTLPEGVEFPFLGQGCWSVYMRPVGGGVVVFAAEQKDAFSVDDRRWMRVMAGRLETT